MPQTKQGALKTLARKAGVTLEEFQKRVEEGQKWCYGCHNWLSVDSFANDRSRHDGRAPLCKTCRSEAGRRRYKPKVGPRKYGPRPLPPKSGNRQQARQRINVEVRTGRRPHPNILPCADCGHIWAEGERRHEYDHFLGYDAEHHYDVQAVCTICHRRMQKDRGEIIQIRDHRGRYASRKEG